MQKIRKVLYFISYCISLFPASTFLTLLLLPLEDYVLVVLTPPGDGGGWSAFGLADQGGVVVLAHAHRRRRAVQVDNVWRNWKMVNLLDASRSQCLSIFYEAQLGLGSFVCHKY